MKPAWTLTVLTTLCASAFLASRLYAAAPAPAASKFDKLIGPIAEAVDEQREGPLMNRALLRQSAHVNSALEAHWNEAGAVQVYLHYSSGSARPDLAALRALGATGIVQSKELSVVQAWVPASELKAAADIAGVSRVGLPRYALHMRVLPSAPRYNTGSVTTEGDQILGAAQFRSATGVTGQGITVGVISDGDDHIADSQKTGDLPANIINDPNDAGSFKSKGDEGTAMMEIVYDLAPGVKQLGFCGPQSTVDFITCLDDFAANIGANVVVDDLQFPGGAMFSDDTFNIAVKSFSSAHPDIRLVTAAGNDALGYWQGTWNSPSTAAPSPATVNGVVYTRAANFGTASAPVPYLQITVPSVARGDTLGYLVEWNDPWSDTSTNDLTDGDYDVVVFDAASGGNAVACNEGKNVSTSGTSCNQKNDVTKLTTPGPQPIQGTTWTATNNTYYLEVLQGATGYGNPGPNLKILVFDNTNPFPIEVNPVTPGSVFSHAALPYPAEISVGAFDAQLPLYSIEPFSALGPVEYGVVGGASQSIMKPDFAAPDDVHVTGAGGFENPFAGTSAAAPHIAGLVALLMAGYPGQSPYTLLQKAAGSSPYNGTFGFGVPVMTNLLNAGVFPVPVASISAPASGATISVGQSTAFSGSCVADKSVGGVKYDWNFGSGSGIADSNQTNPSVVFNTAGTYTVTLTCSASNGSGKATTSVTVNAPSKGGGSLGLLGLSGLGLLYLVRRRRRG